MPHIILELSNNIKFQESSKLLAEIHQILAEKLPTKLSTCKSRVIKHQDFLVGDGDIKNAFVHLSIEVLAGRSKETLDLVATKIIAVLQNYFKSEMAHVDISVAIQDLPAVYHKINY